MDKHLKILEIKVFKVGWTHEKKKDIIKQSYKALAKIYHPDKKPHGDKNKFQLIQASYQYLNEYILKEHQRKINHQGYKQAMSIVEENRRKRCEQSLRKLRELERKLKEEDRQRKEQERFNSDFDTTLKCLMQLKKIVYRKKCTISKKDRVEQNEKIRKFLERALDIEIDKG